MIFCTGRAKESTSRGERITMVATAVVVAVNGPVQGGYEAALMTPARVAHHPDDLGNCRPLRSAPEMLADGVFVGEERPRRGLR